MSFEAWSAILAPFIALASAATGYAVQRSRSKTQRLKDEARHERTKLEMRAQQALAEKELEKAAIGLQRAEAQAAAAVVPHFVQRIDALEKRVERRDQTIETLREDVLECKRSHAECRAENNAMRGMLEELKHEVHEVQRMTSSMTPPASFPPVESADGNEGAESR